MHNKPGQSSTIFPCVVNLRSGGAQHLDTEALIHPQHTSALLTTYTEVAVADHCNFPLHLPYHVDLDTVSRYHKFIVAPPQWPTTEAIPATQMPCPRESSYDKQEEQARLTIHQTCRTGASSTVCEQTAPHKLRPPTASAGAGTELATRRSLQPTSTSTRLVLIQRWQTNLFLTLRYSSTSSTLQQLLEPSTSSTSAHIHLQLQLCLSSAFRRTSTTHTRPAHNPTSPTTTNNNPTKRSTQHHRQRLSLAAVHGRRPRP